MDDNDDALINDIEVQELLTPWIFLVISFIKKCFLHVWHDIVSRNKSDNTLEILLTSRVATVELRTDECVQERIS